MKRFVLVLLLVGLCLSLCQQDAQARWRLFRRTTTTSNNYSNNRVQLTGNDQQRCQQKAQIMASRRTMSHGVAPLVGNFEGIGRGTSRNCSTCTPRRGMTLTGDGAAQASDGTWFRCRSWR